MERDAVEMEMQQAVSSGFITVAKDLLLKLHILNAIRRVMARESPAADVLHIMRHGGDRAMDFFLSVNIYCFIL